jgi:hypothetical protein
LRRREQAMRERIDASITAVEKNANKMARVSNRSSPLWKRSAVSRSPAG